jgi:hypothetical protein
MRAEAVRIYSRVLGAELWIACDEAMAAELHADSVTLPVLLPHEAETLAAMAESDARALFRAVERIQRAFPGARLRKVAVVENSDA